MLGSSLRSVVSQIATQQNTINALASIETPAAFLTLTRTSTLAITTAGTAVTWQSQTRGQGITWSGTDITIPSEGYYFISASFALVANTNTYLRMLRGTVNTFATYCTPYSTGGGFIINASFCLYMGTGDTISFSLTPAANTTVNVNLEGYAGPSPFVHVVQMSGSLP